MTSDENPDVTAASPAAARTNDGQGRGNVGRVGRRGTQGKGNNGFTPPSTKFEGLSEALKDNIFTYGQVGSADRMSRTWKNIINYLGSLHGNDIKTELSSGETFVIPTPQLPNKAQALHQAREKLRTSGLTKEIAATLQDIEVLEKVNAPGTAGEIARLKNNVELLQFEADHEHTIVLTGIDKVEWETDVQSYKKRVELLQTNRGKAFSLIMGQCEERLVHKMQDDPEWKTVQASANPLLLFQLIKRTVLSQSGETYPCASALLRLHTLDTFYQGNLTNGAWYEQFNCQVAIAAAIGVRFIFTSLCEYIAKTVFKKQYGKLTGDEKILAQDAAEELFLAYVFIQKSGKQYDKLRYELQADYSKGSNTYPATRQAALKLLNTCPKASSLTESVPSEGTAFVQKGSHTRYNRNKGNRKPAEDEEANDKAAEKDKKKNNAPTKGTPKSPDDDDDPESSPEKEEVRRESTHAQFSRANRPQHFHDDDDDTVQHSFEHSFDH